jgi:hypothetical protein
MQCPFCYQYFIYIVPFQAHLKNHEQNCEWCRFNSSTSFHPIMINCSECNLCFSSLLLLQEHQKIHSPADVFLVNSMNFLSCNACSISFRNTDDLINHMIVVHEEDKSHSLGCEECKITFGNTVAKKSHLESYHSVDKHLHIPFPYFPPAETLNSTELEIIRLMCNFQCDICKTYFDKHDGLIRHYLRVHDEKHRIMCPYCAAPCLHRNDLYKHLTTEHDPKTLYTCPLCQQTFNQFIYFKKHFNDQHSPCRHKCEHCRRTFSSKYHLLDHQKNMHGMTIL